MDEGGQHGRRHPVLHQVFHPQTGRVLLQDMVLRVQAVQMSPEEVFFPRREEEKKKLFYFLSNECSVIFFRRIWCDPFLCLSAAAATTYFDDHRHSIDKQRTPSSLDGSMD